MFATPLINLEATTTPFTIQDAQWIRSTLNGSPKEGVLFLGSHQSIANQFVWFLKDGIATTVALLANAPLSIVVYGERYYAFAAFQVWKGDLSGATTQLSVSGGTQGFGTVAYYFPLGVAEAGVFFTSPGQNKVFVLNTSNDAISTVLTGVTGARGICRGHDFTFWVALSNNTIQQYSYGTPASPLGTPTLLRTVSTGGNSIISNLVFDGKYVWGATLNTLHRISSDGTIQSRALTSNSAGAGVGYGVDRVSKIAFDGYTIWITGVGRLTRVDPESFAFILNDTSTFSGKEMGAVACSFDGDSSITFAASSGFSGGDSWYQVRTLPNATAFTTVANLSALAALSIAGMSEGSLVYVQTLRDYFSLRNATTPSADGITIVAAATGGWTWVRKNTGDSYWQTRTNWYMGSGTTTASDENDGQSSTTPLATWQELNRRLAGIYSADMTIQMQATPGSPGVVSTSGPIQFYAVPHKNTAYNHTPTVTILGPTPVTAFTGTLTGAANASPVSNTAPTASDTGVASWTASVGKMIQITSGPAIDTTAWIAKDVGSNTARISEWMGTNFYAATPAAGATYKVVTMATGVTGVDIPYTGFSNFVSAGILPVVSIWRLNILNGDSTAGQGVRFVNCVVVPSAAPAAGMWQLYGCRFTSSGLFNTGDDFTYYQSDGTSFSFHAIACLITSSVSTAILFNNVANHGLSRCLFQGAGLNVAKGSATVSSCGFFDCTTSPGYAISVSDAGRLYSPYYEYGFAGRIYGSGNTVGLAMFGGGNFYATINAPTLTGTTEIQAVGAFIKPLVAGAAVPATATLNSWATLSSNFANHYFDYYYGTVIRLG